MIHYTEAFKHSQPTIEARGFENGNCFKTTECGMFPYRESPKARVDSFFDRVNLSTCLWHVVNFIGILNGSHVPKEKIGISNFISYCIYFFFNLCPCLDLSYIKCKIGWRDVLHYESKKSKCRSVANDEQFG